MACAFTVGAKRRVSLANVHVRKRKECVCVCVMEACMTVYKSDESERKTN